MPCDYSIFRVFLRSTIFTSYLEFNIRNWKNKSSVQEHIREELSTVWWCLFEPPTLLLKSKLGKLFHLRIHYKFIVQRFSITVWDSLLTAKVKERSRMWVPTAKDFGQSKFYKHEGDFARYWMDHEKTENYSLPWHDFSQVIFRMYN